MWAGSPWADRPWGAGPAAAGGAPVSHDATGALAADGASIVGSAARTRLHDATGALAAAGAAISGAAARTGAAVSHDASGDLAGGGAEVVGSAVAGVLDAPRGRGAQWNQEPEPTVDAMALQLQAEANSRDVREIQEIMAALFALEEVF